MNIWKMGNLSLLGKITIFKTLALWKIIHLALVTNVSTASVELLRILTGKKQTKIKTPALTKNTNMGIWVVGTSN